jgi:ATP-dependent Lon protease
MPADNRKDLADIPGPVLEELTVHLVDSMDEVLKIALTKQPTPIVDDEMDAATLPGQKGERPAPIAH